MALFGKRAAAPKGPPAKPTLGSGRQLRSALAPNECLSTLKTILLEYRAPKYPHLPPYVAAGWDWVGRPEDRPAAAVACDDSRDKFLLIAFWPQASGTEMGMFPLDDGDERLNAMPIIGHWKQKDPSLSSIGVVPSKMITLSAPTLGADFLPGILAAGGAPVTPGNLEAVGEVMCRMLLAKAYEMISSGNQAAAERFIDARRWYAGAGVAQCQRVLDDMVQVNPAVTPYIQQLPMRARAILLDVGDTEGSFWAGLDH